MDFHYKDIIPWGRSFDEYLGMFNLSEDDLARDIVDVGGGPASFNALMHQRGVPIVLVDPIYLNHRLPLVCRCFGEVFDELVSPVYGPIPAVAVKEERSVVIPCSTNRCVPVSDFVHLLKCVLEQVTP